MLQKEFFQVQPFNPNPYWNPVIVNLSGAQKFDSDTVFMPGRYKIEVAPGLDSYAIARSGNSSATLTRQVLYFSQTESITSPFIVRAYCGSNSINSSTPGTNPYTGAFKVNGVNATTLSESYKPNGIDVSHIFGAGGGNGHRYLYRKPSGLPAIIIDDYYGGGGNCLGDGSLFLSARGNSTGTAASGAGSCLHLIPVGGVFGTNYIRAYHINGFQNGDGNGGVRGGGATQSVSAPNIDNYWFTRGGNSPYGNGATTEATNGQGVGGGKNDGCSAVYFNGTSWVNAGISVNAVTNGVLAPNSMIRITYLGPLS